MQHLEDHFDSAPAVERKWRNTPVSFGLVAIAFHWTIAVLFLAQLALGYLMSRDNIDPVLQFDLFQYHKSIGFLVLALAVPRVIWSVFSRKPRALEGEGLVSRLAARAAHAALLFLTLAVPLAGWAVASTSPLQIPVTSSISSLCRVCPWRSPIKPRLSGLTFTLHWRISQQ